MNNDKALERVAEMAAYLESDRNDAAWPAQLDKPGSATRRASARDLRTLLAAIEAMGASDGRVDAREAFLNMLADAFEFKEEPDGDETGDHTRFNIITGWRQLGDLAAALGIEGPRYMETWGAALDRAIAEPAALSETSNVE